MVVDFEKLDPVFWGNGCFIDKFPEFSVHNSNDGSVSLEGRVRTEGIRSLNKVSSECEVSTSSFELTKTLVKYSNNPEGLPPLLYAIKRNDLAAVKIMLKYGADPLTSVSISYVGWYGPKTAIEFACAYSTVEMVSVFLKLGVDPETHRKKKNYPASDEIESPIAFAAAFDNLPVLKFLISMGVEYSASAERFQDGVDEEGNKFIFSEHAPICQAYHNGSLESFKYLLSLGVNNEVRERLIQGAYISDKFIAGVLNLLLQDSPFISKAALNIGLYNAAWRGELEAAEILLKYGADPLVRLPIAGNDTCWTWMLSNNRVKFLELFIENGVSPNFDKDL